MAWYNFIMKRESTFDLIVRQFESTGCMCVGNITVEIMGSTHTGMLFLCHNNIHENYYIRHYIVNEEDVIYRDYPISPITKHVTNIPIEEGIMSHSVFIRYEAPSIIW